MAQKQKTPEIVDAQLYEDEELVWWGQPVAIYMLRRVDWANVLITFGLVVFAIFFIQMSQEMFADSRSFNSFGSSRSDNLFDTVFPWFFIAVPVFMFAGAGWEALKPVREWYAATKTYYALTNKRAIIIKTAFSISVESFYDENIKEMSLKTYGKGIGDVVFGEEKIVIKRSGSSRSRTKFIDIGFLAIREPRVVEDFVAQMFFDGDKDKKKY